MTARPHFTKQDETFSDLAAYGSRAWVAARLGKNMDWYYRNIDALQNEGFPRIDPIMNAYLKADVDSWIASRQKISATVTITGTPVEITTSRENLNAL